jgi:hypothetical protein
MLVSCRRSMSFVLSAKHDKRSILLLLLLLLLLFVITFMHVIYNYTAETNYVCRVHTYNVAAILYLQCMVHVMLFPPLNVLYFYISWLRHCATNREVAGSIPDGVIRIFHWHNPFCRTMALGSTGGKGGRCVGLTTLPLSSGDCL